MSDSSKRLDLRFGAFACSVQGFDDPVLPVQQVLRALQTLLEESPDVADAVISFDAEAIEQLTEEVARRAELAEADVEITPGLVIVYRGEGTARAGAHAPAWDAAGGEAQDGADAESWEQRFERAGAGRNGHAALDRAYGDDEDRDDDGGEPAGGDTGGHEAAGSGYVNIFAPRNGGGAQRSALFGGGEEPDGPADPDGYPESGGPAGGGGEEDFASRLDRLASDGADESYDSGTGGGGSLFGDDDLPGGDVNIFSDPVTGEPAEDSELEEPLNLFSGSRSPDRSDPDADDDAEPGRPTGNMLASYDLRSRLSDSMSPPHEPEPEPEEEPEPVPADEPFTAEKLAKAAEAETVEDLIVCSAAWMVLMKGQTKFGRRDVLEVFEKLPGDHPTTLEAKIKGFGKAVRNGHLIPVGEGIFGLSRSDLEDFQRLL